MGEVSLSGHWVRRESFLDFRDDGNGLEVEEVAFLGGIFASLFHEFSE
jgi:hypothetical protein